MKWLYLVFVPIFASANVGSSAFPVFLKEGFSSILEFDEAPSQVVLGDQNLFQVEKLNRSIILKPLTAYATTNMFVYFKGKETKMFILTASDEAEPTYYKKFEDIKLPTPTSAKVDAPKRNYDRGIRLKKSSYDTKKDYLTVEFEISADGSGKISPSWDLVRLKYKDKVLSPSKLWSERREVQRDSVVKARAIFTKPNVPADFKNTTIAVPIKGTAKGLILILNRDAR